LVFGETPLLFTLVLAVLSLVALSDVVRNRRALFDEHFTDDERSRILRFVIFVLLPLSVLAHEAGHALAVLAFGGEVVEFGFFLYYGYVGHVGAYTPLERGLISFAGPAVNIALGLGAFVIAWFRPRRAPANYLLFTFAALELANALIFYPIIDATGGIAGDWSTIYSSQTPLFSVLVAILHAVILFGGLALWRHPGFRAGYARRTGQPQERAQRLGRHARTARSGGAFMVHERGGFSGQGPDDGMLDHGLNDLSGVIAVAAALATSDWRHPVQIISDAQAGGAQVIMRWESSGFQRALLVHVTLDNDPDQHVELHAAVESPEAGMSPYQRALARIDGRPTAHELVPYLRRFLDFVDSWDGASVLSPN
jgi:hypothetical protein